MQRNLKLLVADLLFASKFPFLAITPIINRDTVQVYYYDPRQTESRPTSRIRMEQSIGGSVLTLDAPFTMEAF
jgi:hypothetical protein